MTPNRIPLAVAIAMTAALALGACSKSTDQNAIAPDAAAPSMTVTQPAVAQSPASPMMAESAQVSVTSVELGSAVGTDNAVTTATTAFKPKDTIYASVDTAGSGNATLDAKWTYQDNQTVKEDSKTIAPTGPAHTVFSISKPDGWPAGNYKVAITMNGSTVANKSFSVQ